MSFQEVEIWKSVSKMLVLGIGGMLVSNRPNDGQLAERVQTEMTHVINMIAGGLGLEENKVEEIKTTLQESVALTLAQCTNIKEFMVRAEPIMDLSDIKDVINKDKIMKKIIKDINDEQL